MKRIVPILIVCIFVLGCGGPARIRKLNDSSVIVAFGDSLTFGTGASKTESYPSILSDLIKCKVINAGAPGEDTSSGCRRLPAALSKYKPDLVVLCHGGNDMLNKQKQEATIANLNSMIVMIRSSGADIILVGVPKPALRLKAPPFYKQIATQHKIPLDNDTVAEVLSNPSLKSDHAHPNGKGYRVIAEAIVRVIRRSQ